MATYRIFYVERELSDPDLSTAFWERGFGRADFVGETEWEETYEGDDTDEALEAFFEDHGGRDNTRILEEDGSPRPVGDREGWDTSRTYVWVENSKYMEYQGLDVATPGMVACPLCDGAGEVDDELAERFEEVWEAVPADE